MGERDRITEALIYPSKVILEQLELSPLQEGKVAAAYRTAQGVQVAIDRRFEALERNLFASTLRVTTLETYVEALPPPEAVDISDLEDEIETLAATLAGSVDEEDLTVGGTILGQSYATLYVPMLRSVKLYYNGQRLMLGGDYTILLGAITLTTISVGVGDNLLADYRTSLLAALPDIQVDEEDLTIWHTVTGQDFTLNSIPVIGSVRLYFNGVRLMAGGDYTLTGSNVHLVVLSVAATDNLLSDYRRAA